MSLDPSEEGMSCSLVCPEFGSVLCRTTHSCGVVAVRVKQSTNTATITRFARLSVQNTWAKERKGVSYEVNEKDESKGGAASITK